jgi:hypothetical protein
MLDTPHLLVSLRANMWVLLHGGIEGAEVFSINAQQIEAVAREKKKRSSSF